MLRVFHKIAVFQPAEWPQDYLPVADVETNNFEEAFELTNHIDKNWMGNEGVRVLCPTTRGGHRSTSVGDVIVDEKNTPWLVRGLGFEPMASNS